jgi:hypothetical protein
VAVSGANRHDSMLVGPILDSVPAIRRGGRGHPRRRPIKLHADNGHGNPRVRRHLHVMARASIDGGSSMTPAEGLALSQEVARAAFRAHPLQLLMAGTSGCVLLRRS